MTEKRDYYETLGITDEEKKLNGDDFKRIIKQKYRELCKKYHPDKQHGKTEEEKKKAEEEFKEVAEANEILSDPQKRAEYDQFGFAGRSGQGFNVNMDDIMEQMMRMHGFGNPFGGGQQFYQQRIRKGSDIRIQLVLTLEEVFNGVHKTGKYKRNVTCPDCNGKGTKNPNDVKECPHCHGTGMYRETMRQGNMIFQNEMPCPYCNASGKVISNPCHKCNGEGVIVTEETIEIDIPKGVEENMAITFNGMGNMPQGEGIPGDLMAVIKIKQHDNFDKQGSTLYAMHNISVIDCILGSNSTVKSIDGNVYKFKIRQGTMNGEQYRIAGKGLPIINTDKRGDLIVIIKQKMPNSLNNEEIDLLNKLKEMPHFKDEEN